MPPSVIHIVGAGIAGLAAAVRLTQAGMRVIVHEAAGQAGGRCRSYHDPALDMMIDNGNHLLLSGNRATLAYVRTIGASDRLVGPATAEFPFIDLATNERWVLRPNEGRLAWWIFDAQPPRAGTRSRAIICRCCRCFGRAPARRLPTSSIATAIFIAGSGIRSCWPL